MAASIVKSPSDQKPEKVKKPTPTAVARISDMLKKSTIANRISSAELDQIAILANSCKSFLTSAE